jgi:hypothetical protein
MAAVETPAWRIQGEYFENCNCDVVCSCLFSPREPLTSSDPTTSLPDGERPGRGARGSFSARARQAAFLRRAG